MAGLVSKKVGDHPWYNEIESDRLQRVRATPADVQDSILILLEP